MSENSECIYCGETGGHHDVACPMSSTACANKNTVELKPCPFCGNTLPSKSSDDANIPIVYCKCGSTVYEEYWDKERMGV